MSMGRARLVALVMLAYAVSMPADEGMWPFDQFPKDAVRQKYNFEVTQQFLDRLRLASVKIGDGSGAFVSVHGLLLTDRRSVSGCLARLSSASHDYGKDGFYAADESAEARCPGLEAAVLTGIEDVTQQVKSAGKTLQARAAEIARIEKDCAAPTKCAVVTLFSGARYELYRYQSYPDVRLAFAPEYALAFFGAEHDSITYLRYGLDIAFLRVYEDGQPAATPHYLQLSSAGVQDGDLVFTAGDPAATARATTAAQLTYYRDTALPAAIARLAMRIQQLTVFAAQSEDQRRAAQPVLTAFLEDYKSAAGKLIGLRDDRLVLRKTVFDSKIRQAVESDPKLGKEAGKVWDQVAAAYKTWAALEKPYQILEGSPAPGSNLFAIARQLVRGEPLAAADASIDGALETLLLTEYLEELKSLKGKDAPPKAIFNGQTPQQAAEALVKNTRLHNSSERRRLAADHDAVMSSEDGIIRLAVLLQEPARRLRKKREEVIGSLETSAAEKIAQYRYLLFGDAEYPDASFTPRVEFGTVKGYMDRAAIPQPYAATFGGLYYRQNNQGPYQVPQRWLDSKPSLNLVTALDFVSTCDVGGGEYGGATVNRAGELVGLVFDGNLESLPNTYLYMDEQARAVHVAVQGIVQALEKVYRADRILRELKNPPFDRSAFLR